jgi:glycosyltransferase involved in cell wall biosynthesis
VSDWVAHQASKGGRASECRCSPRLVEVPFIMNKPPIYLHTNIPAPYRQHQFEAIAAEFPGSKALFWDEMHGDRPWKDSVSHWNAACRCFKRQVQVPKLGSVTPGLIPELLRQPPDTIHLVTGSLGNFLLLRLLGRRRHGRLVFWNDGGFGASLTPKYRRLFGHWMRPAFSAAFSPGAVGRNYCRLLGFCDEQIFNAFFSHDAHRYDKLRREHGGTFRKRVREELSIGQGDFVLISVSRLLEWKRLEDLSEALLSLEGRVGADVHLILIGDGAHRRPVEEMRARLRRIHLHHIASVKYDDMPAWYAAADLMVFPSEGDIWGLVVNEALSMGVPVICTSRVGAAELVRDGENGFQVAVRAPGEIAARIWQLYRDRHLLGRMSSNSVDIVGRWNTGLALRELERLASSVTGGAPA